MAINQSSLPPDLPDPPDSYDPAYMRRLVDLMQQGLFLLSLRRSLIATTANISQLPTSSTGLRAGDLWNDSGTVKIV